MRIVNLSESPPGWRWIESGFADRPDLAWENCSAWAYAVPGWVPKRDSVRRLQAAVASRRRWGPADVLVSHGPRMSLYGAYANAGRTAPRPHLAFSFNFTTLPSGAARALSARAFRQVDRFVVASAMEKSLYSAYFDIDPERVDVLRWSMAAPVASAPVAASAEKYVCAVGSQGRDYRTLVDAMKLTRGLKLVIVGTPDSLAGIAPADNVVVKTNISLQEVTDLVAGCALMALPLAGGQIPCGHVTMVSAMHLGKPIVATRSSGVTDYIADGENGHLVAPFDAKSLADAIQRVFDDDAERSALGAAARSFASANCSEANVINYFRDYLSRAHASLA